MSACVNTRKRRNIIIGLVLVLLSYSSRFLCFNNLAFSCYILKIYGKTIEFLFFATASNDCYFSIRISAIMMAVVCCSCVKVNVFCWYQWELFMAGMRIIKGHSRHTVRPLLHVRVTLALSYPLKIAQKRNRWVYYMYAFPMR